MTGDSDSGRKTGSRTIAFYAILAGLSRLIPLPFLDDWALGIFRQRIVRNLLEAHELQLDQPRLDLLANGRKDWKGGCLRLPFTILKKLIIFPIRRMIRKILIIFAIKDCVDATSQAIHLGWLCDFALHEGYLADCAERTEVERLRTTMETTFKQMDHRPIEQLVGKGFRRSKRFVRSAGTQLSAWAAAKRSDTTRPEANEEIPEFVEDEGFSSLLDWLAGRLDEKEGYRDKLEQTFMQVWENSKKSAEALENANPEPSEEVENPN